MVAPSVAAECREIEKIAEKAYSDALEILELIELLRTQNTGGINQRLRDAGAGRALIVVRNAMFSRLVLLVGGAYACPRSGDLHIHRAFNLLKNQAVRAECGRRGSAEVLGAATKDWQRWKGDHRQTSLKEFRDKYTAHSGLPDPDVPPLTYEQLFALANATATIMGNLARATGVRPEGLEPWKGEIAAAAANFWKPWTAD